MTIPSTDTQTRAGEQEALLKADLRGANLLNADLQGADLSGKNLAGAQLFQANLQGANLQGANLDGAELAGANLQGANLEAVSARQTGFGRANLTGANLFNADLHGATLTEADLSEADLHCTILENARLRQANLTHADFSEANLHLVDMSLANVARANFSNADLRQARLRMLKGFKKANWVGVDIRDINFAGAFMVRNEIIDQNFIKEFRSSSRLNALVYYPWWISCDCGRSMLRWCFWIGVQTFVFAWIHTLVGVDYGDYPTVLSPVYYSVVTLTTLGYGDIVPSTVAGQIVAIIEVSMGYLMLGGLLSIFSTKLARRGE